MIINLEKMKKIVLGLSFLVTLISFSQKNQIQVLSNPVTIGKSLIDSSTYKGIEYVFPEEIYKIFLDTTTGFLTAQLRGVSKNGKWLNSTGQIVQYDINNQKVLWTKKIAYQTSNLKLFSKTMIFTVSNKSYCLDINTGNELWEVKNNIYLVSPIDNIGFGYNLKGLKVNSNEFEGIDLNNGQVLWKRELNGEYGWNDVFYTNDSTLVVAAAGLHSLDTKTGKGWDYNTITGKKDYTETVVKNVVGVGLGLLTGTGFISSGNNLVRDVVSNKIVDSSNIYMASKEQLVKIDKLTGATIWKFSKDLASKSSIFINDSQIFMINKGMAFMGNKALNFGKPFFAAFDKQTGENKFLTIINIEDNPILSYKVLNGEVFLVYKNRIEKYSMVTGELITGKEFPEELYGELKHFIGNQVFIKNENGDLVSLPQTDTSKIYVFTSQNKSLTIDSELNISKTTEYDDVNIYYLKTKDLKFFAKDNKALVINNDGQQIAEIEVTLNAFIIGDTLYDTKDNRFIAVNLMDLVTNQ